MTSASQVWTLRRKDTGYPQTLTELAEPPRALYGVGGRGLVEDLQPATAVTIVGSRRAGAYGLEMARELGAGCAAAGLVVVSGMAIGCDAAAHEGALEAGGATVAVLGGGPERPRPQSNATLYRRIVATGAVVSEYPPGMPPEPWHFAARDRIMAALSAMTIVVRGAVPSGTMITADEAVRLGREVGAVPGPLTSPQSALPHALIRDGAALIRDAQDVLDLIVGPGEAALRSVGPPLEPEMMRVLEAAEGGLDTADEIALSARVSGSEAAVALARLELMGYLQADAAGRLVRTRLTVPGETEG